MRRLETVYALALVGGAALTLGMLLAPDIVFAAGERIAPGPAPLIGVGLPVAGAVVAAVYFARRFRRRG